MQTPTAELIGMRLGTDAAAWIADRRSKSWSFGRIAAEIYSLTGTYVTAQTIKTWTDKHERAAS